MDADALVNTLAARQGGIVLINQALEFGLTDGMIRHRVRTGRWKPAGARAYRLFDMDGPRDTLRAAVVALPAAIVSHQSAATIHGIPAIEPGQPTVSVHSRTTHTFPGVKVHRTHDLESQHVTRIDDLPLTTLVRTVVDLAAVLSTRHVAYIVDELVAARQLAIEEIQTAHEDVARKGKPGSGALRSILQERVEGATHPGSRLESMALSLLLDAGLPRPEAEYPIPWQAHRRFDLAYPEHKLAIEWDSRRWHSQVDAFERDRKRDRLAVLNGWRVLRFTWLDVVDHSREVVGAVRDALDG
jgi:hypothetical protein